MGVSIGLERSNQVIVALTLDTLLRFLGGVDAIISIAIHIWAIVSLFFALKAASAEPVVS